jgi:hypothetical protein
VGRGAEAGRSSGVSVAMLGGTGAEWRLLELVAQLDGTDADRTAEAVLLARGPLDTDVLLAQSVRHHLPSALAAFLLDHELLQRWPRATRTHLSYTYRWTRHRTRLLVAEAQRIAEALRAARIRFACTKGIVYQSQLYAGRGTRYLADIDLMVQPDSRAEVARTLERLGFAGGRYFDHRTEQLVDLARRDIAVYAMYPDHLPHFVRLSGDPVAPYYKVDVAFSLTWYGSQWQVPVDAALNALAEVPVSGGTLPSLAVPYSFLFAVLHLFREAWFARTIRTSDVRLSQFADVVRLWRGYAAREAGAIRDLIRSLALEAPVAWVCHHTDRVFATALSDGLGLCGHGDERWLRSACGSGGEILDWSGDMRSRLRSARPPTLAPATDPRFVAELAGLAP